MTYSETDLPHNLLDRVMKRIHAERSRQKAIWRFAVSSVAGAASAVSLIFVWGAFSRELFASGFIQYASLLFVDLKEVLINWQDFGMSLLESFPSFAAAELIAGVVVLMISVKFIIAYAKKMTPVHRLKTVGNI